MAASLLHDRADWARESGTGRRRKAHPLVCALQSFPLAVAFLGFLAGGVTLAWLRPVPDLAREIQLCRQVALVEKGRAWKAARVQLMRRSEQILTPEQAIRLLYPNYTPQLVSALRFRPPPAPHNIDVIQAATSRSLRRIALAIHNKSGEHITVSCRFLRLDGHTQWLDSADRSQLLFAAVVGKFGAEADTCCIYQDDRVQ